MAVFRSIVLGVAVLFVVCPTWGQNLVSNADFDADVAGWPPFSGASISWTSPDSVGNPLSGSAMVTNLSTTAGDGTGARQCIEGLSGGQKYRVATDILIPSGQSESGDAYILIQWYDQPGCSAGFIGLFESPKIPTSTPDIWYTSTSIGEAPPGAQAGRLRISVAKQEDFGMVDAHFDHVIMEPVVFEDGFESSDTSNWTSVVGGV